METKEETLTSVKGYEGKPITYNLIGISDDDDKEEHPPPPPPPQQKKEKKKKKKKEKKTKKKEPSSMILLGSIIFMFLLLGIYYQWTTLGTEQQQIKLTLVPFGSNTTSAHAAHSYLYPRIRKILFDHSVKFKQQQLMCLHHVGNLTAEIPKIRVCLFRKIYLMINPTYKMMKKDNAVIETTETSVACMEPKRKRRFEKVNVIWMDEFGCILSSRFSGEEGVLFQMTEDEFSGQC